MEYENSIAKQPEKTLKHLEMASQIASEVIGVFSSSEQLEFINVLKTQISEHYECQIKECESHLEAIKDNYDTFLGNPPKSR